MSSTAPPAPTAILDWLLRNDGLRRVHAGCELIETAGARAYACRLNLVTGRVNFDLTAPVQMDPPWQRDTAEDRWWIDCDDLPLATPTQGLLVVVGITVEGEFLIINLTATSQLSIHSVRALEVARAWALQLSLEPGLHAVTADPSVSVAGPGSTIRYCPPESVIPPPRLVFLGPETRQRDLATSSIVLDRAPARVDTDADGWALYLGRDRSGEAFLGTARYLLRTAVVVTAEQWAATGSRTRAEDEPAATAPAVHKPAPDADATIGAEESDPISQRGARRRAQRAAGSAEVQIPELLGTAPVPADSTYPPPQPESDSDVEVDDGEDAEAAALLAELGHIWVRVLGRIRVCVPDGPTLHARRSARGPDSTDGKPVRETELVVWMALSPHGLSGDEVATLWSDDHPGDPAHQRRRNEFVSRLRRQLGPIAPDTPEETALLERERSGGANFRVHPHMLTDWAAFQRLVPGPPAQAPTAALAAALSLVTDRPFADAPHGHYGFARSWIDVMLDACTDTAVELATRYITEGRNAHAFAAANRGVLADPARQDLWRLVLSTAPREDPAQIHDLITQLKRLIPASELETATLRLIERVHSSEQPR
ncbi:hypothetical protein [Nocardia brasiliensis]|uniref:hypothetical protein n=1 Tax=Nocardia brasiliensis TaxID=37326 RepID=UPI002455CEDB|nr:hypothetical protein [Nocardia brasiliensis]